jgi:hypothetical protein
MNRLKQITTKAKQLYKTGKYAKWTDAIKAASKQTATVGAAKKKAAPKKKAAVKKAAVKKAAPKKKTAAKSYHKDTKSHNVRISVISGIPKNKKYNLFAHIQKLSGNTERLHFFYFSKLDDAKKAYSKILSELKEKKDRGVYTIEIVNVSTLKPVKQITWMKI